MPSCIDRLRELINAQTLFSHLCLTQEIQRHPDQMSLDLVQLLPHLLHRNILPEQMSLLIVLVDLWIRLKRIVLLEGFDYARQPASLVLRQHSL
jgi:hypothetical protein